MKMCESRNIYENIVNSMLTVVVYEQSGIWGIELYVDEFTSSRVIPLRLSG